MIVDAAAEEDLQAYYRAGADLVIYSGAKAIEGPSSGLVIGKTQYVEWVKRQANGIGRAMKVGKEGILGLTSAIEHYLSLPMARPFNERKPVCDFQVNVCPGCLICCKTKRCRRMSWRAG
ncbi:L-seryl-tRNA(Sec) selenium transferase-related protein [Cronobacter universalis NCTC 9529]|nr:L-seryl-tRNA(Sec) selenium transferase-related protein [Cronobacter universalis NCTC 9529]